jgi:hypothetical protein
MQSSEYRTFEEQNKLLHLCVPLHFGKGSAEILINRPLEYKFNKAELTFLKKIYPKKKWRIKYAEITNQRFIDRCGGKRIMLLIDSMPYSSKSNGFETSFKVIASRPLVESEHEFVVGNYGCQNRRYVTYQYNTIEELIADDLSCIPTPANTPKEFIDYCKKHKLNITHQIKIDFNM